MNTMGIKYEQKTFEFYYSSHIGQLRCFQRDRSRDCPESQWDRNASSPHYFTGQAADVSSSLCSEAGGVIYSCKGPDSDSGDR